MKLSGFVSYMIKMRYAKFHNSSIVQTELFGLNTVFCAPNFGRFVWELCDTIAKPYKTLLFLNVNLIKMIFQKFDHFKWYKTSIFTKFADIVFY